MRQYHYASARRKHPKGAVTCGWRKVILLGGSRIACRFRFRKVLASQLSRDNRGTLSTIDHLRSAGISDGYVYLSAQALPLPNGKSSDRSSPDSDIRFLQSCGNEEGNAVSEGIYNVKDYS